jgi:hypothetical protein
MACSLCLGLHGLWWGTAWVLKLSS